MCAMFVFIDMSLSHALGIPVHVAVNRDGLVSLYNGAVGSAQHLFHVPCLKCFFFI